MGNLPYKGQVKCGIWTTEVQLKFTGKELRDGRIKEKYKYVEESKT